MRLEFKEDKIIDILMHAATREAIASIRNELKEDIADLRSELKGDIVCFRNELKAEIIGVKTEFDLRIDKLDGKIDKVIWFIVVSILVPILIQVAPHLLK